MFPYSFYIKAIRDSYTTRVIRSFLWQQGFGYSTAPMMGEPAEYILAAALVRLQTGE